MVQGTVTYEQTPSKRPGEADILNGVKENATASVPPHIPAAEEFMQMGRQIAALARMSPVVRVSIDFNAGVPFIHSFVTVRTDHVIGDFTVTDLGVGSTRVTWAANKFPTNNTRPMATANGTGRLVANAVNIANGFEVGTFTVDDDADDAPVTVEIF